MDLRISHTTRSYPKINYQEIKDVVLGKSYDLSLVFHGVINAKKLNQKTRKKDYVPNVLSFPLDKHHGEIYITPTIAKKESPDFNLTYRGYVGYLFIHGLLHLKGYDHGTKMESEEKRLMKKFSLI